MGTYHAFSVAIKHNRRHKSITAKSPDTATRIVTCFDGTTFIHCGKVWKSKRLPRVMFLPKELGITIAISPDNFRQEAQKFTHILANVPDADGIIGF